LNNRPEPACTSGFAGAPGAEKKKWGGAPRVCRPRAGWLLSGHPVRFSFWNEARAGRNGIRGSPEAPWAWEQTAFFLRKSLGVQKAWGVGGRNEGNNPATPWLFPRSPFGLPFAGLGLLFFFGGWGAAPPPRGGPPPPRGGTPPEPVFSPAPAPPPPGSERNSRGGFLAEKNRQTTHGKHPPGRGNVPRPGQIRPGPPWAKLSPASLQNKPNPTPGGSWKQRLLTPYHTKPGAGGVWGDPQKPARKEKFQFGLLFFPFSRLLRKKETIPSGLGIVINGRGPQCPPRGLPPWVNSLGFFLNFGLSWGGAPPPFLRNWARFQHPPGLTQKPADPAAKTPRKSSAAGGRGGSPWLWEIVPTRGGFWAKGVFQNHRKLGAGEIPTSHTTAKPGKKFSFERNQHEPLPRRERFFPAPFMDRPTKRGPPFLTPKKKTQKSPPAQPQKEKPPGLGFGSGPGGVPPGKTRKSPPPPLYETRF